MATALSGEFIVNALDTSASLGPQNLVIPYVFTANASGNNDITVLADTVTSGIAPNYVVNLSVAASAMNLSAFFAYTSDWSSAVNSAGAHWPINMSLDGHAIASNVAVFDASFEYSSAQAGAHSGRVATDSKGSNIVTPYGDWRSFVEDNAWKLLNANNDVLYSESTSFYQTPLFTDNSFATHVLQLSEAGSSNGPLRVFYEEASLRGKLAGSSLANASSGNVDESGAYVNEVGHLNLVAGDSITLYVKYSRGYNSTYEVNGTPVTDSTNFSGGAVTDTTNTGFAMLIGSAMANLKDRTLTTPLVYQINFNAI